jgi:catechol 2,3-dioxygenase-like lactoylglutathione lyase family enzyme
MRAKIGHIGINLSTWTESVGLWKELLSFLEFRITADERHFDATDGNTYLCVCETSLAGLGEGYHRKRTGLSHIAFRVASPAAVDQFVSEFLAPRSITPLYGGPRAYPEYVDGYYAVFFEDPNRIKLEIVYEPE